MSNGDCPRELRERHPIVPASTLEAQGTANVHLTRGALVDTAGLSAQPPVPFESPSKVPPEVADAETVRPQASDAEGDASSMEEVIGVSPVSTADGKVLSHSIRPEAPVREVSQEQLAAMRRESEERTLEWVRGQMEATRGKPVGKRLSIHPVRVAGTKGPVELYCVHGGRRYRIVDGDQ